MATKEVTAGAVDIFTIIVATVWSLLFFLKPLADTTTLGLTDLITWLVLWLVGLVFLVFIAPLVFALGKKALSLVG